MKAFPQVTLLTEHDVLVVLHQVLNPPFTAVTEPRKPSASPGAFQEIIMWFDEQPTWTLTFCGGQGAVKEATLWCDHMLTHNFIKYRNAVFVLPELNIRGWLGKLEQLLLIAAT